MKDRIDVTVAIDKDLWEKLKKLSGGLEDTPLMHFLFQVGEYILETIKRKSIIIEVNGESKKEEAVDFGGLLDQYGFDELDDFIEKAKPEDFL